jgi:uncharacterized protein YgiB involved in biofilm formation
MRQIAVTVLFLSTLAVLAGCKKQIACDPADSQAVCKGFQDCLRSDTSAEVCRMAEQDANKIQKGSIH